MHTLYEDTAFLRNLYNAGKDGRKLKRMTSNKVNGLDYSGDGCTHDRQRIWLGSKGLKKVYLYGLFIWWESKHIINELICFPLWWLLKSILFQKQGHHFLKNLISHYIISQLIREPTNHCANWILRLYIDFLFAIFSLFY